MFKVLLEPNAAQTWDKSYDKVEVFDEENNFVDAGYVESSEEQEPYNKLVKDMIGNRPYEWMY